MLHRVLEPEVMDSDGEAEEYDSMDHSAVNALFVTDLLAAGDFPAAVDDESPEDENSFEPWGTPDRPWMELLDLGTGTAQIPIELCRRSEGVRIMAVDAAVSMLDLARLNVEIASQTERIMLAHVDAKALPYQADRFAGVISNSIVHHIPEPQAVLAEAVRVTAPGGLIFFRDLLRPDDEMALCRLVDTYAPEATARQRQLFADSLRAALRLEEVRELVAALGFSPESVQATSDRHWTWSVRK